MSQPGGLELRAFSVGYAEAWNAHDVDRIMAHLTDDVVWRRPGLPQALCGQGPVREDVAGLLATFPDLHFPVDEIEIFTHDDPTRAVSTWTARGTMTGRMPPGFEPTGRSGEIHGCAVYRFRGTLLSNATLVYDALDQLQQLGLLPGQGTAGFKVMLEAQILTQRARARLHR